jgi:hypothetical protein
VLIVGLSASGCGPDDMFCSLSAVAACRLASVSSINPSDLALEMLLSLCFASAVPCFDFWKPTAICPKLVASEVAELSAPIAFA